MQLAVQKKFQEMQSKIGIVLQKFMRHHIDTDASGTRWRWQPSHRALVTGGQTLKKSGDMYNDIRYRTSKRSIMVYSTFERALYHNFGYTIPAQTTLSWTTAGKRFFSKRDIHVPRRQFYYLTSQEKMIIRDIAEFYLNSSVVAMMSGFINHNGQVRRLP